MGILLAFSPFIAFALVDRLAGSLPALIAGAAVAGLLILRDAMSAHRTPKLLEIGTLCLFAGMAAWTAIGDPGWSVLGVRLRVDTGLWLITLASIVVRKPFTLQYAQEQVDPSYWTAPAFLRTNIVVSTAWSAAFLAMVLADLAMLLEPERFMRAGVWVTVAALVAALKFTGWYTSKAKSAGA